MTELMRKWFIGGLYVVLFAQGSLATDAEFYSSLSDHQKLWFKLIGSVCLGLRVYLDVTPARKNDAQFGNNLNVQVPDLEVSGLQAQPAESVK